MDLSRDELLKKIKNPYILVTKTHEGIETNVKVGDILKHVPILRIFNESIDEFKEKVKQEGKTAYFVLEKIKGKNEFKIIDKIYPKRKKIRVFKMSMEELFEGEYFFGVDEFKKDNDELFQREDEVKCKDINDLLDHSNYEDIFYLFESIIGEEKITDKKKYKQVKVDVYETKEYSETFFTGAWAERQIQPHDLQYIKIFFPYNPKELEVVDTVSIHDILPYEKYKKIYSHMHFSENTDKEIVKITMYDLLDKRTNKN